MTLRWPIRDDRWPGYGGRVSEQGDCVPVGRVRRALAALPDEAQVAVLVVDDAGDEVSPDSVTLEAVAPPGDGWLGFANLVVRVAAGHGDGDAAGRRRPW